MKKTPLYDWHLKHGAKLVEFGGYLMPVSYEGVLAEHQAVRQSCGLFDISHMGEFFFEGVEAGAFLQYLTTNDISKLHDGCAQYSLLLKQDGGIIDDIIVYRIRSDRYMLCVNAANIAKDLEWIKSHLPRSVKFEDRSDAMAMVALQGPSSAKLLSRLGFDLFKLERFQFIDTTLAGVRVLLSRTGYTGEEGCEFFLEGKDLLQLWEALLTEGKNEGVQPIGLGARDTLRLEMGYSLYGHELREDINPFEAGLAWVVKLEGGDFIGRETLLRVRQQGPARQVTGFLMEEPGIPRQGLSVYRGQELIGEVLSGTFSPTLKIGIGTALLKKDAIPSGGEILIDIRGKMKKAKITKLPFIKRE